MILTTIEYGREMPFVTLIVLTVLFATQFAAQPAGSAHQGILRPEDVPVEEAIAEGEGATRKPGIPLASWRHAVSAPPDRPAVREVTVVTPYYRVAREAYLRASRGERLTPREASALLGRATRDYGSFPIGLLLVISPAPRIMPHPQAIQVVDASGRRLPVRGFLRPDGQESMEIIISAEGADLRWIRLVVPVDPAAPQQIRIDLREVK